jgi:hypothetical protein
MNASDSEAWFLSFILSFVFVSSEFLSLIARNDFPCDRNHVLGDRNHVLGDRNHVLGDRN